MSLIHRVDIGLRHVLPALPALFVLAGFGWASLWRRGRVSRGVAGGLALWLLFAAARTTPDHLAYFNELAGGPGRGDRILIDSNLDWGQDEHRFRRWAAGRNVSVNPPTPREGLVAANVNAIRGIFSRDDRKLRWLNAFTPERTIGHTWRIFRVDRLRERALTDPARALTYARFLLASDRGSEALEILRKNDLSHHEKFRAAWSEAVAEALLSTGDLAGAALAASESANPDLEVELAHRVSDARGIAWSERDERERARILPALWRRRKAAEARELAAQIERLCPGRVNPWFRNEGIPAESASVEERLAYASFLYELGREELALQAAGRLLANRPSDEEALWLYGELVVRRKLGLSEYPLPDIDWSGIR
jgi:hypothetical protein